MREPWHRGTVLTPLALGARTSWELVIPAFLVVFSRAARPLPLIVHPRQGHGLIHSEQRVHAVLETSGYQNGHWGLLVVDMSSGLTVYEQNSNQLFASALVAKLFSVAAALVELGADHRFETPIVRRGEIDNQGTLHGDLVLIAQGDPAMGGRAAPTGHFSSRMMITPTRSAIRTLTS